MAKRALGVELRAAERWGQGLRGERERLGNRIGRLIDRAILPVAPLRAERRELSRRRIEMMAAADSYRSTKSKRTRRDKARSLKSGSYHADAPTLEKMREDCADQERNGPFTKGLLELWVDQVLGTMRLQCQSGSTSWNQQAEEMFADWAEMKADYRGERTLFEMTRTTLYAPLRDGDCGFVLVRGGRLQPVEAGRIATPSLDIQKEHLPQGHSISQGVETGANGRVAAYWICPWRASGVGVDTQKAERVPAQNFIHVGRKTRFSHDRAVPALHASLELLEMMDQLCEATVVGAQVAACFGVVIKRNDANEVGYARSTGEENDAGTAERWEEVSPGRVEYLDPGEEVDTLRPDQPAPQIPQFLNMLARFTMFGLGLPVELFNFQEANFSNTRAANNRAKRTFRSWQRWLKEQKLRRIFRWKVSQFMKYGGLPAREDAWKHDWMLGTWESVDPLKDITASMRGIDHGLSSWPDECAARGKDWDAVLTDKDRVIEMAQKLAAKRGVDWHEYVNVAALKIAGGGATAAASGASTTGKGGA